MIQKSPFLDYDENKNSGGPNRYFGENILNVGNPEYRLFFIIKKIFMGSKLPKKKPFNFVKSFTGQETSIELPCAPAFLLN